MVLVAKFKRYTPDANPTAKNMVVSAKHLCVAAVWLIPHEMESSVDT
jgi:hypothetical protein